MTQLEINQAAERNKQPILNVLRQFLPPQGYALEIASGTGQHVAWFAAALPHWTWQPSDARPQALGTIATRVSQADLHNVRSPLLLDVRTAHWWPDDEQTNTPSFDLIYCANMLHISPWATCAALMEGASRHLTHEGRLVTYGPYLEDDVPTSAGNLAFDKSLRVQDSAWGIRRLEDVAQAAEQSGLALAQKHAMPANNLLLVWQPA
jgi:hypothetical protein